MVFSPRRLPSCFLAVLLLLISLSASAFTPSGLLEIHQINVQQGESALVIGPDGTTLLLDSGKNGKGATIVTYMQGLGLNPADGLDFTIAGHMDSDHVGGFDEVIQAGYNVRFGNYFNGSDKTTTTVEDYKTAAAGTTAGAVIKPMLGETVQLGNGATLTFVAVDGSVIGTGPVAGALANENDRSLAVLIEYGTFDYIWASDLGGGSDDNSCTGRSTSQTNVETPLAQSITPGGAWPLLSAEGVDVLHVNHHGSESSTNSDYMNLLKPELAVIPVGAGQGGTWHHPRQDILDEVLLANATCVTAPPVAKVLQTEEGSPTGAETSFNGFAVGDIKISTDGVTDYFVEASGNVTQGPDERAAAGLPMSFPLDESGGGGGNAAPVVTITAPATGSSFLSSDTINFTATADDAEDGDLGTSISWNSDLDGALGSGQSIAVILSSGSHLITASVTDSGGRPASNVVNVTVNEPGGGGDNTVLLSEVYYDAASGDDGFEWVELYNSGTTAVDLSGYSLGAGGTDYTYSKVQLAGSIAPGATMVIGGPTSDADNGNPVFDLVINFSPDFQNSGSVADGVALFDVPAASVTASTIPVDAVVYGATNSNNLIDETGIANAPEVGDAPASSTIERIDLSGTWQIQGNPTPNSTPLGGPANAAPTVTFSSPADGSSFDEASSITFTGSADDAEDGDLSASLNWSSDLDGAIGSGASFSTSTLSVGTHLISLDVTDSGGLSASTTRTITINTAGGPGTVTFTSVAGEDGWLRESNESSNTGGSANDNGSGSSALRLGDERKDKQYKVLVSFDTASIPDGATVTSVTLRLRRGQVTGTNPFNTHGTAWVDVNNGGFDGDTALDASDFEANATVAQSAALSNAAANDDWSEATLDAAGLAAINATGTTQLRIYFATDDNDDRSNDYIGYYSGDDSNAANHPQLVVSYQ